MKKIKNIKIVFILVAILLCSTIVYAVNYEAKDIIYKDNKTVEYALNDLYTRINTPTFGSILANSYEGTRVNDTTTTLELNKGKYLIVASYQQGWIKSGNTSEHETTNNANLNFTYTNSCNLQYINTRNCYSGSSSNNTCSLLFEDYYFIDVVSNNTTLSATFEDKAGSSAACVLNITAIPYEV